MAKMRIKDWPIRRWEKFAFGLGMEYSTEWTRLLNILTKAKWFDLRVTRHSSVTPRYGDVYETVSGVIEL